MNIEGVCACTVIFIIFCNFLLHSLAQKLSIGRPVGLTLIELAAELLRRFSLVFGRRQELFFGLLAYQWLFEAFLQSGELLVASMTSSKIV